MIKNGFAFQAYSQCTTITIITLTIIIVVIIIQLIIISLIIIGQIKLQPQNRQHILTYKYTHSANNINYDMPIQIGSLCRILLSLSSILFILYLSRVWIYFRPYFQPPVKYEPSLPGPVLRVWDGQAGEGKVLSAVFLDFGIVCEWERGVLL